MEWQIAINVPAKFGVNSANFFVRLLCNECLPDMEKKASTTCAIPENSSKKNAAREFASGTAN
ncbi:hypothetical protein BN77_1183 [Rhizobium mesoamericanum STM3625]|uniref:Uncharacterized protein n=1 Tax=Rhizobium mesoamericanum STM3625 TaxID=1211777 RepID=K0PSC0_9HYPH|nr:hypothetical protein BN77_1183 [Rhizobium mesoamericanum STM3625]